MTRLEARMREEREGDQAAGWQRQIARMRAGFAYGARWAICSSGGGRWR